MKGPNYLFGGLYIVSASLLIAAAATDDTLRNIFFYLFGLCWVIVITLAYISARNIRRARILEHYEKTCHDKPNLLALDRDVVVDCGSCGFYESLGPASTVLSVLDTAKRHDEREVDDDKGYTSASTN